MYSYDSIDGHTIPLVKLILRLGLKNEIELIYNIEGQHGYLTLNKHRRRRSV